MREKEINAMRVVKLGADRLRKKHLSEAGTL